MDQDVMATAKSNPSSSLHSSKATPPASGRSSPRNWLDRRPTIRSYGPTIIVEAVMLTTIVGTEIITRPIYVSPTAIATRLLPAVSCDFGDILHLFTGTQSQFQLVLRVVSLQAVRLFCHEAYILGGVVEELLVENAGVVDNSEMGMAYILTLPKTAVIIKSEEELEARKRIQVFDQERRLLFTKEWQVDTGILNEDAISWLRDSHYPIPVLQNQRMEESTKIQAACVYSVMANTEHLSEAGSISESFVNLDEDTPSRSLSRSDSIITLKSPSEISHLDNSFATIDLFQQMGFWLYGTRLGQMMANSYDPRENSKTLYSQSPIWLMGQQFKNDQIDNMNLPSAFNVGPVSKIENLLGPAGNLELPMVEGNELLYLLKEGLIITPFEAEIILVQLASWLECNGWNANCTLENEQMSLQADLAPFTLNLSAPLRDINDRHFVSSSIKCDRAHALRGRTVFVDILSELMAISAGQNRRESAIEFVFLSSSGCTIDIGPHPNSLVQIYPGTASDCTNSIKEVLLWSEHIHDWICREIYQDPKTMNLIVRSPATNIDPLTLDLSDALFFFFADSSLRFAISHASSTWLCFRAINLADFTSLLGWLPSVLRNKEPVLVSSSPREEAPKSTTVSPKKGRAGKSSLSSKIGGMEDFLQTFEGCFWFTYRRDFPRLSPSILSSDAGFGCMIRAGQSMIAEAIAKITLGTNRRLDQIFSSEETCIEYKKVVSLFLDTADPAAIFSILHLTRIGVQLGTPIGQHFNPSVLSRVLRKQCKSNPDIPFDIFLVKQGIIPLDKLIHAVSLKPQLILVPLRLGADTLNPDYSSLIKATLSSPQSLGIIGGRAARAFYIIGYQDDALLYLDPHLLRPACSLDQMIDRRECHTRVVCELSLPQLDPTILFGFLCRTQTEVEELSQSLLFVPVPMPLFSISHEKEQAV